MLVGVSSPPRNRSGARTSWPAHAHRLLQVRRQVRARRRRRTARVSGSSSQTQPVRSPSRSATRASVRSSACRTSGAVQRLRDGVEDGEVAGPGSWASRVRDAAQVGTGPRAGYGGGGQRPLEGAGIVQELREGAGADDGGGSRAAPPGSCPPATGSRPGWAVGVASAPSTTLRLGFGRAEACRCSRSARESGGGGSPRWYLPVSRPPARRE